MTGVVIAGIGMHPVGEFPGKLNIEMGREATLGSLKDAGISFKDLNVAYFARNKQDPTASLGELMLGRMGLTGMPIVNVENEACSGSSAFVLAYNAIHSGLYDVALAAGIEKSPLPGTFPRPQPPKGAFSEAMAKMGLEEPLARAALTARRREVDYGELKEVHAHLALKNLRHASKNPLARVKGLPSLEAIMAQEPLADPLGPYECAKSGDEGAAAVVLCAEAWAKKRGLGKTIKVVSALLESPKDALRPDGITRPGFSKNLAQRAYEAAGVAPKDLDVIELSDFFSVSEIIHYEDLGLCEAGSGGRFLMEGHTKIGGRIPVNPSGGFLGMGCPVSCVGLYQIGEIVLQLRGQAKTRQIEGASVGLAHTEGLGPVGSCVILKR